MTLIGLDIGHGIDTFPPSKGIYKNGKGYAEHSFNAKLGIAIKKLLEQNGHTVLLGQQPNAKDVPLRTRTNLYNSKGVDLVISVHANYNASASVNGRCAFYWGTSSKSKSLAQAIINEIKAKGYSTHGNGLHAGEIGSWTNLHINRETKMPAVLVEHGFMSGNKDFDLIFGSKQDEYIKDMAEADVRGIQKWLGQSFKGEASVPSTPSKPSTSKPANKTIEQLADEVIAGKHGTGDARKKALGSNYSAVQALVNKKLGAKPASKPSKSIEQLAQEVIAGKYGSGEARKKALGSNYQAVQKRVNQILGGATKPSSKAKGVKVGDTVTTKALYANSGSTKNVRSSSIKGYVDTINNNWRNPIRLRNKKGGYYLGFTRKQDLV